MALSSASLPRRASSASRELGRRVVRHRRGRAPTRRSNISSCPMSRMAMKSRARMDQAPEEGRRHVYLSICQGLPDRRRPPERRTRQRRSMVQARPPPRTDGGRPFGNRFMELAGEADKAAILAAVREVADRGDPDAALLVAKTLDRGDPTRIDPDAIATTRSPQRPAIRMRSPGSSAPPPSSSRAKRPPRTWSAGDCRG